jgi:DNA-binding Lrp family transcriptional regulator
MSIDVMVLRAMLRLARRCEAAEVDAVADRVGAPASAVRAAMRRLSASGVIERRAGRPPRLTMAGLAIAVATLPAAAPRARTRGAKPRASRAA